METLQSTHVIVVFGRMKCQIFLQGLQILSLIPLKKKKPFMALLVTGDLRPQEWNHIEAWSGGYGPHKLLKY